MKKLALFAASTLLLIPSTQAAVLTFDLAREFSGGTAPTAANPWVRVSFDDGGSAGSVTLKVQALALTGSEFLTDLYLNLDPTLNANALTFGTETQTGTFALPTKAKGTNAINGNAAGTFDLSIAFATGGPNNRFSSGDEYSVVLGGLPTLTASSFNFSSIAGGRGSFPVAAHVQGIGLNGNQSGKITTAIPEPATLAALGGMLGVAVARRRRGA